MHGFDDDDNIGDVGDDDDDVDVDDTIDDVDVIILITTVMMMMMMMMMLMMIMMLPIMSEKCNQQLFTITPTGKTLTNADAVWFGRGGVATRCAIGKDKAKEITCFQGQVEADFLEIRHKFSRRKEWCEIQIICETYGY